MIHYDLLRCTGSYLIIIDFIDVLCPALPTLIGVHCINNKYYLRSRDSPFAYCVGVVNWAVSVSIKF